MADDSRVDRNGEGLSKEAIHRFTCSICLDLLYKPVITACGHMFCFWCIHIGMDGLTESTCPLCRRSFIHFPRVCKLLHFILMKVAPDEYGRRGREVFCFEEKRRMSSPEIEVEGYPSNQDSMHHNEPIMVDVDRIGTDNENGRLHVPDCEGNLQLGQSGVQSTRQGTLGKADLSCALCHELLYFPVVLNCGDVFCKPCLKLDNSKIHCPACGAAHPAGSVLVCLELDQFLQSMFPAEYANRQQQHPAVRIHPLDDFVGHVSDWENESILHLFVGCDGCGMFPIVGDRYKCEDCKEVAGYDLCGICNSNAETMTGRFNQMHQSTHRMKKISILSGN